MSFMMRFPLVNVESLGDYLHLMLQLDCGNIYNVYICLVNVNIHVPLYYKRLLL